MELIKREEMIFLNAAQFEHVRCFSKLFQTIQMFQVIFHLLYGKCYIFLLYIDLS